MGTEKKTVLVVDDEPDVVEYFRTVLQDNGFEVMTAPDGKEAWKLVESNRPDLVTLDISMPEKSGIGFYRDLRENPELRDIPVVIVTGVDRAFERFISTRKSVPPPEGYLAKPVDARQLVDTVRRLLSCKAAESGTTP
ncbi:MAG: response regulator [Deltaproteobacteria bacterium]|nr:MAG: response regulator [Deltaproteobacteria bacterium]